MKRSSNKHICPVGEKKHNMRFLKTDERGDWFECTKCGIWVKEKDLHKYDYE